jgi:Zn-dependent protease
MFKASYKIARIMGIPIKLHISLIILLVMLVQDIGIINGPMIAAGLLISIVLHELGHSFVAIRKGCRVREITLMFMGGAAVMEQMPRKPFDEFLMAIAGPAVSLVLGVAGIGLGYYLPTSISSIFGLNIIESLGAINLSLLVFNLLPSFPMDGGRVLRAALTPKLGRLKATLIAARMGQVMAIGFGIIGLVGIPGILAGHNWTLVVIAFFIFAAAGSEYQVVLVQETARQRQQQGFSMWPPFSEEPPPLPPNRAGVDKVIISPPPYEKQKRGTKADIRSSEDADPFRDMFGQS